MRPDRKILDAIEAARRNGWQVDRTRKNHIRVTSPDGRRRVIHSGTPGDYRGGLNFLADLRRAGAL